jgi:transposase
MNKKYHVRLTEIERQQLKEVIAKGNAPAYQIRHAHILLKADIDGPAWQDAQIAQAFCVHYNAVAKVRQVFQERGLKAALGRRKQDYPSRKPIFDGVAEAHLIALSCSQPPQGYDHWTLKLLANRVVQLQIVDQVSSETVRRTLKKRTQASFS